ncbi:hypothetical protein [Sulfuritalea sp.]|uniref:hypothetical protein n=1 Tax=Sulfuritalea sp. TaxID=2480090 RepID=UPI001AC37B40|nr:hypothetical protein [Sulfuritalea sp.]MBN8474411.1 hypothetical protein [Sulfuritalea sp.]
MRLALAIFFAALAIATGGCSDRNQGAAKRAQEPQTKAEPARKLIPRYEFKALVFEKNWDGVIAAVGKPDRTQELNGREVWHYIGRTYDPITNKPDRDAQVTFQWTICDGVNFF